jgi:hypothetical protein
VNRDYVKIFRLNDSGLGCFLSLILIGLLLGSVGLGWIVNSFLALIAFLLVLPVFVWWGFRWWLRRNLVESECPVCSYQFTGFNGNEFQCPNCGEPLKVVQGRFQRLTPPGTIDVEAVEVPVKQIED